MTDRLNDTTMLKRRRPWTLSLLILAPWPGLAQAEAVPASTEIRLSTIEYPPLFQSTQIPGKGYGIASDLTQAAFEAVNISVKFDYIPMARTVDSVINQRHPANLGSINWFIKDRKEKSVKVVNLFNIGFKLFYKKVRFPKGLDYDRLSDLKTLQIGNVRGSSTTPVVNKAGLNIRWISTLEQNFKMLNADRIDLAVGGETAGWTLIKSLYPDTSYQFAAAEKPIHQVPIGLVFHRSERNLIERFNQGIDIILQNGTYMDIVQRYYGDKARDEHFLTQNIRERQSLLNVEPGPMLSNH